MRAALCVGLAAWLAGVSPCAQAADQVRLKNGNLLEGTITSQDARGVVIDIPGAGSLTVSRGEIAAITAVEAPVVAEPVPASAAPTGQAAKPPPVGTVDEYLMKVFELIGQKDYPRALVYAQKAVAVAPNSARAHAAWATFTRGCMSTARPFPNWRARPGQLVGSREACASGIPTPRLDAARRRP